MKAQFEKHNLLTFIQENKLEEFTTNELYLKLVEYKHIYYCYYHTLLTNSLNDLVKDSELKARYISESVEPFYSQYSYAKPYRKRNNVGSKTITIYKYVKK